jgi:hypothetical protein
MVRKKRSQERRPAVASVCRRRRRNSRTFAESSRLRLRQQKMELPPALSGAPNLTPFAARGSGITTSVGLVYQDLRTNTKVAHVQCGEQSKHPRLNVEKTVPAHVVWCRGEGVKAGRKSLYRRQAGKNHVPRFCRTTPSRWQHGTRADTCQLLLLLPSSREKAWGQMPLERYSLRGWEEGRW